MAAIDMSGSCRASTRTRSTTSASTIQTSLSDLVLLLPSSRYVVTTLANRMTTSASLSSATSTVVISLMRSRMIFLACLDCYTRTIPRLGKVPTEHHQPCTVFGGERRCLL